MDKPKIIWRDCSFCNTNYNEENMTKITYEEPHMEPRSYYICPHCASIYNEILLLAKIYQQIHTHTGVIKFENLDDKED